MANDLKLEVYKIKLSKKATGAHATFGEFLRNKLSLFSTSAQKFTDADIFKKYYADIMDGLDSNKYNGNNKRKKGFTIAKEEDEDKNLKSRASSPTAKDWVISGIIEGGKYDRVRTLGDVEDTSKKSPISKKHIVCDLYYFLIYINRKHHEGVFMMQSYSEDKISDVLRDFIVKYFTYMDFVAEIETFVPVSLKEKYIESSIVKSLSFSTVWQVHSGFDSISQDDYDIQIKVQIIDKSKEKHEVGGILKFLDSFKHTKIAMPDKQEKELDNFTEKKAVIGNTGKASTVGIDFDKDDNIKLSVPLKDYNIFPDENGTPPFSKIDTYSRDLLTKVIQEIIPKDAVLDI